MPSRSMSVSDTPAVDECTQRSRSRLCSDVLQTLLATSQTQAWKQLRRLWMLPAGVREKRDKRRAARHKWRQGFEGRETLDTCPSRSHDAKTGVRGGRGGARGRKREGEGGRDLALIGMLTCGLRHCIDLLLQSLKQQAHVHLLQS